jgi:hypothetical protein
MALPTHGISHRFEEERGASRTGRFRRLRAGEPDCLELLRGFVTAVHSFFRAPAIPALAPPRARITEPGYFGGPRKTPGKLLHACSLCRGSPVERTPHSTFDRLVKSSSLVRTTRSAFSFGERLLIFCKQLYWRPIWGIRPPGLEMRRIQFCVTGRNAEFSLFAVCGSRRLEMPSVQSPLRSRL